MGAIISNRVEVTVELSTDGSWAIIAPHCPHCPPGGRWFSAGAGLRAGTPIEQARELVRHLGTPHPREWSTIDAVRTEFGWRILVMLDPWTATTG